MSDSTPEIDLIAQAVAGDRLAMDRLLLRHHPRLLAAVAGKLPDNLRSVIQPEDVLQEAYASAIGLVRGLQSRGDEAFFHWLLAISENRLLDLVKAQRAAKRGGSAKRVSADLDCDGGSIDQLLNLLAVDLSTASTIAARTEACEAVTGALVELPPDYAEVVRLRYLDGLSVADTAARMSRTEGSVHMLAKRALTSLREILGRSSKFYSR